MARSKYSPLGSFPDDMAADVMKVPKEPPLNSTQAVGSGRTKAVFMLMLAPKAPGPLADVPSPRCTCTPDRREVSAGIFTQNTSCDSASFRVMPLSVTLICEPLLPRMVMDEFPRPVPFSL